MMMTSILEETIGGYNVNGTGTHNQSAPQIEAVRVGDLTVDHSYQRIVNGKRVHEYSQRFDPNLLGIPVTHRRHDGRIVILDGQHRIEALKDRFGAGHTVDVLMHHGLSLSQEAWLFYHLNQERLQMNARAMWHAALLAEKQEIVRLNEIVTRLGLRVSQEDERGNKPGTINAASTLIAIAQPRMANRGGGLDYAHFERVLTILLSAWGDTAEATHSDLLKGLDAFLRRYGASVDEKQLIRCMVRDGANDVRQRASSLKLNFRLTAPRAIAMSLVGSYNHGRRNPKNRLPDWNSRGE